MPKFSTLARTPKYIGVYEEVEKLQVRESPLPLFVHDNTVFANSQDIAATFGLTHGRVIRIVNSSLCERHAAEHVKPGFSAKQSGRRGLTYTRSFNLTIEAFLAFSDDLESRADRLLAARCVQAFDLLEQEKAQYGASKGPYFPILELDAA